MDFSKVIKRPVITEKSSLTEQLNKHTFVVHSKATKIDIKNAFRTLYGVEVVSVNTIKTPSKTRLGKGRRPIVKRPVSKKVVITLKPGQKFDFNKIKEVK